MAVRTEAPRVTVADLVAKLEAGVASVASSEGWREYLAMQAKLHTYSLGNTLLIAAQMPTATRVCGFHGWLRLGRHVRKGEHGIRILAPVTGRRDEAEESEETDANGRPVRGFRVVTVFDISSTDGEPLAEHPCRKLTTDSERGAWLYAKLLDIARAEGIPVREDAADLGTAHGCYYPARHAIDLAAGLSDDHKAKTLCHEMAHAFLHRTTGKPRAEQEAEAEGTAFVVSAWAGLDTSQYSFGYVADWAGRQDGPALVRRVGSTIQKTAAAIIGRLAPEDGADARESA